MGTYTDIYTFLRLLFSRAGSPFVGYSDTFSFNHPDGKCPTCDGLGKITEINLHQLVDYDKSLNKGPIDFPHLQLATGGGSVMPIVVYLIWIKNQGLFS